MTWAAKYREAVRQARSSACFMVVALWLLAASDIHTIAVTTCNHCRRRRFHHSSDGLVSVRRCAESTAMP